MFNINGWELIIILVIVLIVIGPERLPEFMYRAGQLIRQFRQATDAATSELTREFKAAAALAEAQVREPVDQLKAEVTAARQAVEEPFRSAAAEVKSLGEGEAGRRDVDARSEPPAVVSTAPPDLYPPLVAEADDDAPQVGPEAKPETERPRGED